MSFKEYLDEQLSLDLNTREFDLIEFKSKVFEAKQLGIVYHFTTPSALEAIIKSGSLN